MKNDQPMEGFRAQYGLTELGLIPATRVLLRRPPPCNNPRLKHIVHRTPVLVVVK